MFRFQNTGVLKLNNRMQIYERLIDSIRLYSTLIDSIRLYSTLRFFPAVSLYSQKGHLPNFQSFNF